MAFIDLQPTHLKFYNSRATEGYQGPSKAPLPCKVRCAKCGSLIMDEGRNMVLLFPTLLDLDNDDGRKRFEVQ